MNNLPALILASQSLRRKQLLNDHGYEFRVIAPDASVEEGICSRCSPEDLVLEAALLKAKAISQRVDDGMILAADTVAVCQAEILGKPTDRDHAARMLRLMSGKQHRVITGVCLWHQPSGKRSVHLEQSVLTMDQLSDAELEAILETDNWVGKAGGFGYQDGLDWLHLERGLESNIVGLPVERLPGWIEELMESI